MAYQQEPQQQQTSLHVQQEHAAQQHQADQLRWERRAKAAREECSEAIETNPDTGVVFGHEAARKAPEAEIRGLTKISMNFSPAALDALRMMAKGQGITMTEVVRRALSLQRFVVGEIEAGGKLLVEERDGRIKRVVLP
jgi:hypothetical protein